MQNVSRTNDQRFIKGTRLGYLTAFRTQGEVHSAYKYSKTVASEILERPSFVHQQNIGLEKLDASQNICAEVSRTKDTCLVNTKQLSSLIKCL